MNVSNQREPDSLLLPVEKMKGRRWQLGEAVFDFDVLPNLNKERAICCRPHAAAYDAVVPLVRIRGGGCEQS